MKRLKNIWVRISVFLRDKNKKSYSRILKEVFTLMRLKKEIPLYYFAKFLYRKEIDNYQDYLSGKETGHVFKISQATDPSHHSLVRNKRAFGNLLEKNGIKTPEIIARNNNQKFIYKNEEVIIKNVEDLVVFFKNILVDTNNKGLFVKPNSDQGGKNCFVLEKDNLDGQLRKHAGLLLTNDFIYQKLIVQHPEINAINASCVNSIRFNSYIDRHGKSHILSAFMRFGRNGNVVDNGSSGGFYVAVDINSGQLENEGKQLMRFGGGVFYEHPDSSYDFNHFKIPFFKEACDLIHQAIPLFSYKLLGWDIAIEHNGPLLIEANDNFSVFVADIAYKGYLRHPQFKEIMNDYHE